MVKKLLNNSKDSLGKLAVFFFILLGLFSIASSAQAALKIISRKDLNFPLGVTVQEENLSRPTTVVVAPIFLDSDEYVSDEEWLRGLYYYQAIRLNQGDILFHYVVDKDGNVYEGNKRGDEQRVPLQKFSGVPVLVGYLADKEDLDFTDAAKKSITDLSIDVVNRHQLGLDSVQVRSIEYHAKEDGAVVAQLDIIGGRWQRSIDTIEDELHSQYDPTKADVKLRVVSVKVPDKTVKFDEDIIVDIKLKNEGKTTLYQGTELEPIAAKVEGDFSVFYINGLWLSPTELAIMPDGAVLRSGESMTFQLRLKAGLYFGQQIETFRLKNLRGEIYENTEFDIEVTIDGSEVDAVEITATEVGYLNVRTQPNGSAEVITRVSPGQRFVVEERSTDGWVKIDIGDNQSGWIAASYTRNL